MNKLSERLTTHGGGGGGRGGGGGSGATNTAARSVSIASKWFAQGTVEYFWYRLLTSLDSHSLSSHLTALWSERLYEHATGRIDDSGGGGGGGVAASASPKSPDSNSNNNGAWEAAEEAQAIQRCCVLSKFLGLLLHAHA